MAFLLGAIAIAGWFLGKPYLRSFLASGSQMKANTAFCLMATAVALAAVSQPNRGKILLWASRALTLACATISVLTLIEYVANVNLGIDQLLFYDTSTVGTSSPGRMSPPTAAAFLFGALAVLFLDLEIRDGSRPAEWLAIAMAFVPAHILMSYAYGNMNVLAFGSRRSYMAVPTAIGLLLIAIALLLHAPNRGIMHTLTARTQASAVFRWLLLALLFVLPMLGWFVLRILGGWSSPPEFGVSTTIMLCIVVLAALAWHNATRLNRAEMGLQQAKSEAEKANRAKDQFLAMLSHELRTPLTPVLMTIASLRRQPDLNESMRNDLEVVQRNVELEALLIDDLLDLTRIAHGKFELHTEAVDIHLAIEQALAIASSDFVSRQLRLTKNLLAREHHCWADGARLQQVFWNLIKNAVKFTPPGGHIEIRTRNDDSHHIIIDFSDSGIGIDAAVQPRIFDAFEQGGPMVTRRFGGLGLGLAICKRVLDMHGGSIAVQSDDSGSGATFTIKLKAMETSLLEGPSYPLDRDEHSGRRAEILLVEDHEDTAHVMVRMLENAGYRVRHASSVATAQSLAAQRRFQLLISDVGLPDGSGLDLMRELHHSHGMNGIAISGFGMTTDINAAKKAGFAEHFTKPFDWERLRDAIDHLMEKNH